MRKVFFFLLFIASTLYAETDDDIRSHFPNSALASSDGALSSIIDGKVCAITGDYVDYQVDMAIDGPEPLILRRFYAGNHRSNTLLGTSWDLSLTIPAEVSDTKIRQEKGPAKEGYAICVREASGGAFVHEGTTYKPFGIPYSTLKPKSERGFTNCGYGHISGKTNPLNNIIHFNKEKHCFDLFTGAGEIRSYSRVSKGCYLIKNEWKANGCQINYHYKGKQKNRLIKIDARDSTLSTVYGDIHFEAEKEGVSATGSNGDTVAYKFIKKTFGTNQDNVGTRHYLSSVKSNTGPNQYYKYENKENTRYLLVEKAIGQNHASPNKLILDYYDKGKHEFKFHPFIKLHQNGDVRIDRVKSLANPYGVTHEFIYNLEKIDGFSYCCSTDVYDAKGNRTTYSYSPYIQRLNQIQKFEGQNKLLYSQELEWNGMGSLLSKKESDACGKTRRKISYKYDKHYNVTEEVIEGDLVGWKQKNSFTHWFKYSTDGYNNLIAEGDTEGPTIEYEYIPRSNILSARFVVCDGIISMREFKIYDEGRHCIEEIYDNGSSRDCKNLKDVTERLIVKRTVSSEPLIYGKPLIETLYYYDPSSKQEALLRSSHYGYDERGRLAEEAVYDSQNNHCYTLEKRYDERGNLILENDPLGYTTLRTYDIYGNVITECGPDKRFTTKITYDDICRPIIVQKCISDGTIYTSTNKYNQLNQVTTETDFLGRKHRYKYDAFGNCIEEMNPMTCSGLDDSIKTLNAVWREFDCFGNVTRVTGNDGSSVTMDYNARNQITYKTYPDGSFEKWVYSPGGRLLCHRNRIGVTVLYTHDRLGNCIQEEVIGDGSSMGVTTFIWKGKRLQQITDPLGNIRQFVYDGAGRLVEEHKDQSITKYTYDTLGRRAEESVWKKGEDTPLAITYTHYDYANRVIEEGCKSGEGQLLKRRQYAYDASGNKIATIYWAKEDEPSIVYTDYDTWGRPVKIQDPEGRITRITYSLETDPLNNAFIWVNTTTDPLGRQTIEKLDSLGRPSKTIIKDPFGTLIYQQTRTYDLGGRQQKCVISVLEDGKETGKQIYLWSYNQCGDLIEEISAWKTPEQSIITHAYTSGGLKKSVIKADGNQVSSTHDPKGRIHTLTDSYQTISYTYTYNDIDQIIAVQDNLSGILIEKSYDENAHLKEETINKTLTLKLQYSPISQLTDIIYPDGSTAHYQYESTRLKSMVRNNNQGNESYRFTVEERNLFGKPLHIQLPGAAGRLETQYDKQGRSLKVCSDYFSQEIQERDGEYKPLSIKYKDSQGQWEEKFAYDHKGNLTSEQGLTSHTYSYDSLGNRIISDNSPWKHNKQNQLLATDKDQFTYDPNGNLLTDGKNKYHYDALNRLVQVETPDQTIRYTYDNQNRRLRKTVNEQIENYAYIGNDEIGTYNNDGTFQTLRILSEGLGADIGATVAIECNDTYFAPIHDHRGSLRCLVNGSTGEEAACFRYSAFGEVVAVSGNPELCPWQFSSKRLDPETGLTYFGLRYYDPQYGRWTTLDPAGFSEGPNGYLYVNNRPLCFVDCYGNTINPVDAYNLFESYRKSRKEPNSRPLYPYREYEDEHIHGKVVSHSVREAHKEYFRYKNVKYHHSCRETYPGKQIPNIMFGFVNGIMTSINDFRSHMGYISKFSGGYQIDGVYNASFGFKEDLNETQLNSRGYDTEPVFECHRQWTKFFANSPRDSIIIWFCHSQGTLLTYNALITYDEELRKRIHVVAVAPAKYIPLCICGSVIHYVSCDSVPWVDLIGRLNAKEDGTLRVLDRAQGADWMDHNFQSETYKPYLEEYTNKFMSERSYGIN